MQVPVLGRPTPAVNVNCLECGEQTSVIDSRAAPGGIRRRRQCSDGHRFTTYESACVIVDGVPVYPELYSDRARPCPSYAQRPGEREPRFCTRERGHRGTCEWEDTVEERDRRIVAELMAAIRAGLPV